MAQQQSLTILAANPATHLRLWFHAAALDVAAYLAAVGGPEALDQFPFLTAYRDEIQPFLPPAADPAALALACTAAVEAWEDEHAGADWPLLRLRRSGLRSAHLLALLLAGLVEEDARFGPLYAALHPVPDEQRLTVGLLSDLLQTIGGEQSSGWAVAQTLLQRGLLLTAQLDRPRAAWPLRVPGPVWDACRGERLAQPLPGLRYYPPDDLPPLAMLAETLPAEVLARLTRLPALLDGATLSGVILRGMRGSGRLDALGGVARALGCGVLALERPELPALAEHCARLGPLSLLYNALPAIELELPPGETVQLPPLPGYDGPLGIILGAEGHVQGAAAEQCLTLSLPPPRQAARRVLWERSLGGATNGHREVIAQVSAQLHLTGGTIMRAGGLARAYAALDGRAHVQPADVQEACRTINRQTLETLATRIETGGGWDDLVVSEQTRAELQHLLLRCRRREAVLEHLGPGFGRAVNRGVRALLSGVSGTGKTLTARILAAALGLDLYRVDLSAVVNKYIGETERNLSQIFARAEEHDVILLLDEGDSLLTSRTDVRSANDRYANMETNYLLQRLETYEGILLVTTNAGDRIDRAFGRRMDVQIEFSPPDAAQRYRIWQLHLAPGHRVGDALLRAVATRCALSGGQIRNAALHATFLAVDADRPLSQLDLVEAIAREYRKLGAGSPLGQDLALL